MTDAATPEQPRTAEGRALLEAFLSHGRPDEIRDRFVSGILAIEAQARPAVASEGLRAALEDAMAFAHNLAYGKLGHDRSEWRDCSQTLCERARAALASDAGSVGTLDVPVNPVDMRNLLLLAEAAGDEYANGKSQRILPHMERLQAAVDLLRKHYPPKDAERQGEQDAMTEALADLRRSLPQP